MLRLPLQSFLLVFDFNFNCGASFWRLLSIGAGGPVAFVCHDNCICVRSPLSPRFPPSPPFNTLLCNLSSIFCRTLPDKACSACRLTFHLFDLAVESGARNKGLGGNQPELSLSCRWLKCRLFHKLTFIIIARSFTQATKTKQCENFNENCRLTSF